MQIHDTRSFGSNEIDLGKVYWRPDPTTTTDANATEGTATADRNGYDDAAVNESGSNSSGGDYVASQWTKCELPASAEMTPEQRSR